MEYMELIQNIGHGTILAYVIIKLVNKREEKKDK